MGDASTGLIEYAEAPDELRVVFDDIEATRGVADANNFWKALAPHPETLRRTMESGDGVGALRPADEGTPT